MNPSWFEHVDLINTVAAALFMAVIWFMVQTLKKIDTNQTELFNRLNTIEKDLYELRGEHKAQHSKG